MPRNDDEENSRGSSEAAGNESDSQDAEEGSDGSDSNNSNNNDNDDSEENRGTGNDAITAPSSGDDDDDEEVPTAPFAYPADEPEEGGFQDEDPLLAKPDDEGEAEREAEAPANIAHDPMIKPLIIYIVATIIISAILFPILFLVVLPGRNEDNNKGDSKDKGIENTPVPATTPPVTPAPTPFEWALDLPDAWKTTIQQQPTSSIAQAYDWVASDPSLKRYSQGQLKQRLALVGLYYGAGGAEWTRQTNWLSYWATECQWEGVICDNSGDAPATTTTSSATSNSTAAPTTTVPIANATVSDTTNSSGNIFEQEAGKRHYYVRRHLQAASTPNPFDMVNFLQLANNNMKGTISEEISLLTDLTFLELQENGLMGTIPDLLYDSFVSLLLFNVSHNGLQGTLPPNIAKWSTLALLDVSQNQQFTGLLPSELGLLPALNSLDVSHNQFLGALPTELGLLGILRYLDAGQNQLVGRIPPQLGSLAGLTNLLLDNNNLSGQVPVQLGVPPQNLQQLDISVNPLLTGVLPDGLCLVDDLNFTCHPNEDLRVLCGCGCSCHAQLPGSTNGTQFLPNATAAMPGDNITATAAPTITNTTSASNSSLSA